MENAQDCTDHGNDRWLGEPVTDDEPVLIMRNGRHEIVARSELAELGQAVQELPIYQGGGAFGWQVRHCVTALVDIYAGWAMFYAGYLRGEQDGARYVVCGGIGYLAQTDLPIDLGNPDHWIIQTEEGEKLHAQRVVIVGEVPRVMREHMPDNGRIIKVA